VRNQTLIDCFECQSNILFCRDGPTDLELMLMKNKAAKAKSRRKKGGDSDEINDWDNKISAIISEMKSVAAEDRAANEKQIMSLQKQKMLPLVRNMLEKTDYHATMIELGVLGAIAEWLAPLPDRSLPNISIREFMIATLVDFGEINADYLKSSGIGKTFLIYFSPRRNLF
jgi:transcription factor SPN1